MLVLTLQVLTGATGIEDPVVKQDYLVFLKILAAKANLLPLNRDTRSTLILKPSFKRAADTVQISALHLTFPTNTTAKQMFSFGMRFCTLG
jgi:hypothetical protein